MDATRSIRHTVAVALGSNLGDKPRNIESALRLLESPSQATQDLPQDAIVSVVDTSFLYETAPMYVTDQPTFINCACIIETNVKPEPLLRFLKTIEASVGRVPSIRNGPRAVDLDIIFYDDLVFDTRPPSVKADSDDLTGELVIPHPRLTERDFVLRPLNDMIPDYIHPGLRRSVSSLLNELNKGLSDISMVKVVPIPHHHHNHIDSKPPSTLTHWTFPGKTRLMGTLNATPDSFSDGSLNHTVAAGLAYAQSAIDVGASVIDVGGYSTRPGAAFVSNEEEKTRVCSIISAIRDSSSEALSRIPISVDTFRWDVAEAAIKAGANIINDVYAFTGPHSHPLDLISGTAQREHLERMKGVARKYTVPVIVMHSRGDAGSNKDYQEYTYANPSPVLEAVRVELGVKVNAIVKGKGCVRRWLVIVDPGIGFSKTVADNLALLRNTTQLVTATHVGRGEPAKRNPLYGYPTLVGPSRKSFLGAILAEGIHGRQTQPKERDWATAAAVACAVQQQALVIRVHEVGGMSDVIRVSDALWR